METYVTLVRLRPDGGTSSSTQGPDQIVKEIVERNGGKLISSFATLGLHDLVLITQFPDKESCFQSFTELKVQHNWLPETMQATELSKFDSIYSKAQRSTPTRR